MIEYAPYWDSEGGKWRVIKKDEDGFWFNFVPDAGSQEYAKQTAEAMNERERKW